MPEITQIDTSSRAQVRRFLDLPDRLYRDTPQWVPPLRMEARGQLDRRRHPFYRHSDAAFFLAVTGGRALGRIAVLEHRPFNTFNGQRTALFYLFECENDPAAAAALISAAADWARARGLDRLFGPKGFSPLDGMGLLVEGFQHRPALGIPYNLPYYPALLEANGFATTGEVVSGYLSTDSAFPQRIHDLAQRVRERRGLEVVRFKRRADLRMLLPQLKELYNLSIEGTPDNYPLADEEVQAIADQMLRFADPRLIKVVMKGERIVGYLFAYPDISAAQQRHRGRLLPFGWAGMLLEMRRTRWANINGMGILQEYRGLGGTALLFSEMQKSLTGGPFEHADLVQIGTENDPMLRELRAFGVQFYKKHRMYSRAV